jgi:hypothetical protein
MARKKGINKPRHKSKSELLQLWKTARERKRTLKTQSKWLRREHLRGCVAKATTRGDNTAAKEIILKISREAEISMWKRINWTTKDPFAGSLLRVEVEEDGKIVEKTTEPELVSTIFNETDSRFSLASSAPISSSSLAPQLGNLGFTSLGEDITSGNFIPPPDLKEAKATILEEIGELGRQFRDNHVNIEITGSEFSQIWGKAKEKTSSSMEGIHFGHWIAASGSTFLSNLFAKKISLITRTGSPPQRWRNVLMVMIQKTQSNTFKGGR